MLKTKKNTNPNSNDDRIYLEDIQEIDENQTYILPTNTIKKKDR